MKNTKVRQIQKGHGIVNEDAEVQVAFRHDEFHAVVVELTIDEAWELSQQLSHVVFDDFVTKNGVDMEVEPF